MGRNMILAIQFRIVEIILENLEAEIEAELKTRRTSNKIHVSSVYSFGRGQD